MEYRIEILGGSMRGAKPEDLEALLNRRAEEGWQLNELLFKTNTSQLWVVLQRESEDEKQRPKRRSWLADWS
jgi:hypothetical protein